MALSSLPPFPLSLLLSIRKKSNCSSRLILSSLQSPASKDYIQHFPSSTCGSSFWNYPMSSAGLARGPQQSLSTEHGVARQYSAHPKNHTQGALFLLTPDLLCHTASEYKLYTSWPLASASFHWIICFSSEDDQRTEKTKRVCELGYQGLY